MRSAVLIKSASVVLCAASVNCQATNPDEPLVEAEDIQEVVPTQYLAAAQATSIAAAADSFIASVTAAPEYSSVLSVLATAIPATAQAAIGADPSGYVLDIIRGSPPPAWATSLPPSIGEYIESLARDAAEVVTEDFGGLYTSVSSQVAALETGLAGGGGFVVPTGGYLSPNYTAPQPTESAAPPGSNPASPGSDPAAFEGSASPLRVKTAAAAVIAMGIVTGALLVL
ncbi:MAG: hypothetical protein Q9174_003323 [Haloplaca sp. 1 TL-2023]